MLLVYTLYPFELLLRCSYSFLTSRSIFCIASVCTTASPSMIRRREMDNGEIIVQQNFWAALDAKPGLNGFLLPSCIPTKSTSQYALGFAFFQSSYCVIFLRVNFHKSNSFEYVQQLFHN